MSRPGGEDRALGFTLVEILVVLSLLGLVMSLVLVTVLQLRSTLERVHGDFGRRVRAEQALAFLEREVRSATVGWRRPSEPTGTGEVSRQFNYPFVCFEETVNGRSQSRLRFCSLSQFTHPGGGQQGAARGVEVSLGRLDYTPGTPPALLRRHEVVPTGSFERGGGEEALLDGVWGFRVECFDGSAWRTAYDAEEDNGLPRAVRVTLTLGPAKAAEAQQLTRTWLLQEEGP
jgi:prepilin-type N-terminal cleavage/methylation domain-containing protein